MAAGIVDQRCGQNKIIANPFSQPEILIVSGTGGTGAAANAGLRLFTFITTFTITTFAITFIAAGGAFGTVATVTTFITAVTVFVTVFTVPAVAAFIAATTGILFQFSQEDVNDFLGIDFGDHDDVHSKLSFMAVRAVEFIYFYWG